MKTKSVNSDNIISKILLGIALLTITSVLLISLATFDLNDPSYNNATDTLPNNFFGYFGSYSSDLTLQMFGLGGYFMLIIPFLWGTQYVSNYRGYNFFIRFITYIFAILLFLILISNLTPHAQWIFVSYGGSFGNLLYVYSTNLQISYLFYIQIILFVLCLYFAIGYRISAWIRAFTFLYHNIMFCTYKIWRALKVSFGFVKTAVRFCKKNKNTFSPVTSPLENTVIHSVDSSSSLSQEIKTPPTKKTNITPPIKQNSKFTLPSSNLLNRIDPSKNKSNFSKKQLEINSEELSTILQDFGVQGEIIGVYPGPVVTLYEFQPAAGTKSSRVVGLSDDIARTMCASSARISVMSGKNSIGIELPNETREIVYLRELIEDKKYREANKKLPMILGKNISGEAIIADLAAMPHLLVAGTTGSGKSVAINTMILSLLYSHTPEECKFIMIDPKMLELSVYDGIPHLLAPVVTEPNKAVTSLKWVVREMENRYRLMTHLSVRNIDGYNHKIKEAAAKETILERKIQTGFDRESGKPIYENVEIDKTPLPFIVVIVDEMADLMIVAGKEIEGSIQRLAQMARAAGIHIIMATQRPSVDVITGVIKANFPTRISFHVTSKIDSRTILGEMGAEQLLGKGDMLFMSGGSKITRVHGPFVDDKEVEDVVKFLKSQATPDYSIDITEEDDTTTIGDVSNNNEVDELYQQAVELITREQKASTSYLQRYFKIGYNRAATIIDQMEQNGVISSANHVGKREILVGKNNEN